MITITAYRAAIGSFYGAMRKCMNKEKTELITKDDCFKNCFFDTYKRYTTLCIVRRCFPNLLKVFDIIGLCEISKPSDVIELLLSGDVEQNPGPETFDANVNKTNTAVNSPGRPIKQKIVFQASQ